MAQNSRKAQSLVTPSIPAAQERVLREQQFDLDSPGTLLRDFDTLLRYVGEHEVALSGATMMPSINLLPELNQRMAHPVDIKLQRPQWKSFPNLSALYLLLRASGLSRVEAEGKRRLLRVDPEVLRSWDSLNPTERYFTLLETWLLRAREDMVAVDMGLLGPLHRTAMFLANVEPQGRDFVGAQQAGGLRYFPGLHNLWLLEEFGIVSIQHGPAAPGQGWQVERVEVTPWGDALLAVLVYAHPLFSALAARNSAQQGDAEKRPPGEAVRPFRAAPSANLLDVLEYDELLAAEQPFGLWQQLFQPYLPQWQHNLALPELPAVKGTYVFKVSLGRVWRRLAVPSKFCLADLAGTILHAFKFDEDHLYLFRYRDRFGAMVEANHAYMDEPPFADEVLIGELPLQPGDSMKFVFDFGDDWRFSILLERIDPAGRGPAEARILAQEGKAPEQYAGGDEE